MISSQDAEGLEYYIGDWGYIPYLGVDMRVVAPRAIIDFIVKQFGSFDKVPPHIFPLMVDAGVSLEFRDPATNDSLTKPMLL